MPSYHSHHVHAVENPSTSRAALKTSRNSSTSTEHRTRVQNFDVVVRRTRASPGKRCSSLQLTFS